jgi:hypothetical protein
MADSDVRQAQLEDLTESVLDFTEGIGIIQDYNHAGRKIEGAFRQHPENLPRKPCV